MTTQPDRNEDDAQQRLETREKVKAALNYVRGMEEKAAIDRAEFHVWLQEQLEILRQGLIRNGH